MNVLVVGGTGMVGSQTVPRLAERGVAVRCMTRSAEKSAAMPEGIQGVVGDLGAPETLPAAFEGVEAVFLIVTVAPDAKLTDVIEAFERHKVKRVPVVQDERLVGVVSRADVVRALVAHKGKIEVSVSSDDRSLRDSLLTELRKEDWFNLGEINIMVVDRHVQLWGVVYSEDERQALCLAAERLPGVRGVEDHLALATTIGYA